MPRSVDAGLLYFTTDTPPTSWQDLYKQARKGGLIYQGAAYEGLTVNFLELAYAAGATVVSEDGRSSELDSKAGLRALKLMRAGLEDGAVPRAVLADRAIERALATHGRATASRTPGRRHPPAGSPGSSVVPASP